MLIECLVKRVGPTPIIIERTKYVFMPIPGAKKGETSTSVCDVTAEAHLKYMLDPLRRGNYREYDQEQAMADLEADRRKENAFLGFHIQKYKENGYIIVDMRIPKEQRFSDMSGVWVDRRVDLSPWPTEMEAFSWLKGEIEMGLIEPVKAKHPGGRPPGSKNKDTESSPSP